MASGPLQLHGTTVSLSAMWLGAPWVETSRGTRLEGHLRHKVFDQSSFPPPEGIYPDNVHGKALMLVQAVGPFTRCSSQRQMATGTFSKFCGLLLLSISGDVIFGQRHVVSSTRMGFCSASLEPSSRATATEWQCLSLSGRGWDQLRAISYQNAG